jgi:hypothetical protein
MLWATVYNFLAGIPNTLKMGEGTLLGFPARLEVNREYKIHTP